MIPIILMFDAVKVSSTPHQGLSFRGVAAVLLASGSAWLVVMNGHSLLDLTIGYCPKRGTTKFK